MSRRNIFILGLDELNHQELRKLPGAEEYAFHQLLTVEELQAGTVSVPDLLDQAHRQLDAFEGSIDAIAGYWDFPISVMVPILCQRYGLPSADLEAVAKCEHKYWSRLEQQKVIEDYPAFGLIDVDDSSAEMPEHVSYPAWIKPVKSTSSEGAHRIADDQELHDALEDERHVIGRMGDTFTDVLQMLDLPEEIEAIGGSAAMVEEAASGDQYTVEGFSHAGGIEIYGVIDSMTYEGSSSFLRYQYPSELPQAVQERMAAVTRKVIAGVGLDHSTFNIEYFWNPETQKLNLLEINARHSQSHDRLFELVDGRPNHAAMLDLALGRKPAMLNRDGPFDAAATWFLRRFTDGVVRRVPTAEEVQQLEQKLPGTAIQIDIEEGHRLSDADAEDSNSFALAEIFTAGADEQELIANYEECVAALHFEIEDRTEEA